MLKLVETEEQINLNKAVELLRSYGVSYESICKFNICYENNNEEKTYNRIIFPVYDEAGNECGIVARKINKSDTGAKYTVQISDNKCIYGLNFAIHSSEDSFILCEGILDTILLHQNGFDNAVGCLRFSISNEMALQLRKYKTRVYIIFDSDNAGKENAKKAADILAHAGMKAFTIDLGDYLDPMQMMQSDAGIETLRELIKNADNM